MFLQPVKSPGIAHISYIFGDNGKAAVVDPRRDCEIYFQIARDNGCRITHIFETHRNEDYVIGSVELAAMTGATICHGGELPFTYGEAVADGDKFSFGSLRAGILHTPGHTMESISIALTDTASGPSAVAVFTGDALFIGDVGRTDFFPGREEEVAGMLYDSIFGQILPLGDHVILYPAHGAGSVCGGNLSSREFSTLGYERFHNPVLQFVDRDEFIAFKSAERHHRPPYFDRMEIYNLSGPPPMTTISRPGPLSADEFADAMDSGMVVLDVRSPEAFGGAHIPGSLNIGLDMVPIYAGWFIPPDARIGLVVENASQVDEAVTHLARIGFNAVIAYLDEGMHEWETGGREFEGIPLIYIDEIKRRLDAKEDFTLLDVRPERGFEHGHLQGAVNIYLGKLPELLANIPPARPITTFCGSGHRAITAASILRRHGFTQVECCLGSMAACRATLCPLVFD